MVPVLPDKTSPTVSLERLGLTSPKSRVIGKFVQVADNPVFHALRSNRWDGRRSWHSPERKNAIKALYSLRRPSCHERLGPEFYLVGDSVPQPLSTKTNFEVLCRMYLPATNLRQLCKLCVFANSNLLLLSARHLTILDGLNLIALGRLEELRIGIPPLQIG